MAYTIDILIKIKELGAQVIEEIDNKLKDLQGTVQATKIEDFGDIGGVFETVSGSIDNIESSVGTIEALMVAAVYRVAREVDATIERASEKFGASIIESESRAVKVLGAATGAMMIWGSSTFQKISGYFKTALTYNAAFSSSWKLLYGMIGADVRVIFDFVRARLSGLGNLLMPIKASFDFFMKGSITMGAFMSTFMLQISKIGVQLWISQISILIIKDAFRQTVEFTKRLLGLSTKSQSILAKTTGMVNYLSDGVQVINVRLTEVIKPLTYASAVIAGMQGLLPGLTLVLSVPAMLNTMLSLINRIFQRSKMYIGTLFGSARSQLNLIFAEGKDFLTSFLLNTRRVTINTRNWALALQGAVISGKKLSHVDYFRGIYGMGVQDKFTLIFFKIDTFIKNISAEIRTLTLLIAHIFNIPEGKIEQLRSKATGAITEIDQKTMSGFMRAKKFAQNFLMFNFFGRLLKSFKPLAPLVTLPFKALKAILITLPFAGLKAIFGLFKKPVKIVEEKGLVKAKEQENALKSISKEIQKIKIALQSLDLAKIAKAIESIDSKIPAIAEGTKKVVSQVAVGGAKLRETGGQIEKLKQGAEGKVGTGFRDFFLVLGKVGSSGAVAIQNLVNAFQRLWLGTGKTEAIKKTLSNLYKEIEKLDPASAKLMEKGILGVMAGAIPIKTEEMKKAFAEFGKSFYGVRKLSEKQAEKLGANFVKTISEGIKDHSSTAEKAASSFAKMIASFFPPDAVGPLSGVKESGEKISGYIAEGMKKGNPKLSKQAKDGAEAIAKNFPRSLPLVGPLVNLISMGFKIPMYIARGMRKGFNLLRSAASAAAKEISEQFERAAGYAMIGERIGMSVKDVSLLDAVIGTVGGSISEASMSLTRLNAAISDMGKAREFAKLGIDLASVQKSATPTMTVLLKISDILKYSAKNTTAYKTAIQLLATTAGSKFVTALRKGSTEIAGIMARNKVAGMYYNEEFATISRRWVALVDRLKKIRQFSIGKLLQGFTKEFSDLLDFVNDYLDEHSVTIVAYMSALGTAILGVGKTIAMVMKKIISDPKSAFEELKKLSFVTIKFVGRAIALLFEILKTNSSVQLNEIFVNSKQIIVKSLGDIFDYIVKGYKKIGLHLLYYVYNLAKKILDRILKLVKKIYGFFGKKLDIKIIDRWGEQIKIERIEMQRQMVIATRKTKAEVAKQLNDLKKFWDGYKSTVSDAKEVPIFSGFLGEMDKVFDRFGKMVDGAASKAKEKVKETVNVITKDVGKATSTAERLSLITLETALQDIQKFRAEYEKDKESQQAYDLENFERELEQQQNLILAKIDQGTEYGHYKDTQRALELSAEKALALKKKELNDRLFQEELNAIKERITITAEIFGNMGTMFADLYEMSGRKIRAFAIAEKAVQIGQATMRAANAVLNALYSYPPPFSFIAAGATAAMAAVQVAKIASTSFAAGGQVIGGSGTKDDVPAMLTGGEYVVKQSATGYYTKKIMDALNARKIPRGLLAGLAGMPGHIPMPQNNIAQFAAGGQVGSVPNDFPSQSKQNNGDKENGGTSVVVVPDPALLERYLAERAGQNAILVVLQNNAAKVREIVSRG